MEAGTWWGEEGICCWSGTHVAVGRVCFRIRILCLVAHRLSFLAPSSSVCIRSDRMYNSAPLFAITCIHSYRPRPLDFARSLVQSSSGLTTSSQAGWSRPPFPRSTQPFEPSSWPDIVFILRSTRTSVTSLSRYGRLWRNTCQRATWIADVSYINFAPS